MCQNRNYQLNESGMIAVRNPAAFWIPQITVREEIHGGTYTVTGSYEGREPFDKKPELPWPAYGEENRWTMILRKDSQAVKDPMPEERKVLFPILDYRLNASYAEMKFNVPFVWKGSAKILLLLLAIGLAVYLLLHR